MAGGGGTGFEGGGGRGAVAQDFDLNIAPIIDCFVVLISFMLASAAFISIGLLDAGIAAGGAQAASQTPPPISITIELKSGAAFVVKVSGKETSQQAVAAAKGERDLVGLTQVLERVKSRWPQITAATLQAENTTEYKEIILTMEAVRKTLPAVMLGGF